MLEFLDAKTILVIIHLFGVVFGVGGAISSDLMFFTATRDHHVTETEMTFLTLGSMMVWIGLALLVLSGGAMVSLDTEYYLSSTKFLAKMTIVGILLINACFFHFLHIPRLKRHIDHHFPSSDEFVRGRIALLASGVISIISWTFALILGALRTVPYPYLTIMAVYAFAILLGLVVAIIFKEQFLPSHKPRV